MIDVITKDRFVTTPWKNGKGVTTELAISEHSTLNDFDWRLSIATVSENGVFSDFSGVERTLFLIAGSGIELTHQSSDATRVDCLESLLSYSCFDGGNTTTGRLLDGEILDLNLMTREGKYKKEVHTLSTFQELSINMSLENEDVLFIYTPDITDNQKVLPKTEITTEVDIKSLDRGVLVSIENERVYSIKGESLIAIKLTSCK